MSMKISLPESNTNISLNVAGKSVKEAAEELGLLAWILKTIAESGKENAGGFTVELEDEEAAREMKKPIPTINYSEWMSNDKEKEFMSNNIIHGYEATGRYVSIIMEPSFVNAAITGKSIDGYCKERMNEDELP